MTVEELKKWHIDRINECHAHVGKLQDIAGFHSKAIQTLVEAGAIQPPAVDR